MKTFHFRSRIAHFLHFGLVGLISPVLRCNSKVRIFLCHRLIRDWQLFQFATLQASSDSEYL